MSFAALLKKLEAALGRGRGAAKKVPAKKKKASRKRSSLTTADIERIKRQAERNAAAYTAEWKRKHPELARRFAK